MSSKNITTSTKEEARPALVPKLRFPEFRGAEGWKKTPLENCLDYQQPTPYLVDDTKYSPAFKTPVLTAGKTFILGYTDEQHGIFSEGLPVIIFDDFTTATQFVVFPFKAKSSAMKILQAKNGADIKFMYETLQTISYEVGAHERHWISNFAPMLVPVPKPAEQQKIASCLSSIDDLITAEGQKIDALKDHKKGLMHQLFPREGETVPRLRFPEFSRTGEWVCEALSHCLEKVIDYRGKPPPKAESGVPLITAKNVRFGYLDMTDDEYIETDAYDGWMSKGIPKAGDVLFTTEAPLGNVALFPASGRFALGQRIITLRCKSKKCVPEFLFQSLLGQRMQETITFHSTGSTAKGIKSSVFVTLSFCYPKIEEQHRIATCLSSLDALITAENQKLEALKTHKKGLMQQLFLSTENFDS